MLHTISLVQTKQHVGFSRGRLMGHNGTWMEQGRAEVPPWGPRAVSGATKHLAVLAA